jgi:FkbM family methyltransferase
VDDSILIYQLALGNETGEKEMFVETANKGQSCSVLEPKIHLKQYPKIKFDKKETVTMDKLDNIEFDRAKFNMINVDTQGYELEVFKGATETLQTIDIIYSEVNFEEVYKGCVLVDDLDKFLGKFGFVRILTDAKPKSWGDALYLKYN